MKKKYFTTWISCLLLIGLVGCGVGSPAKGQTSLENTAQPSAESSTASSSNAGTQNGAQNETPNEVQNESSTVKEPETTAIDWDKPSDGTYPTLAAGEDIWLDVSIKDQRVYVKDGDQVLYSMVMSSGLDTDDNSTPTGTYSIQAERGTWFYSGKVKEGAEYWVSWKNHGQYLFHSVPMDKNKNVISEEAEKLGQKASHGCIRLSIPDAKWIYEHIKEKTKVVIRN